MPNRQYEAGLLYAGGLSKNQVARCLGITRQGAQNLLRKFMRRLSEKGLPIYRQPDRAGRPPRTSTFRPAAAPTA
jgi:predicted ArsR family transcriptional regulator